MGQDWTSVAGQLVKVGAPAIGTVLGGPAGGLVGDLIGGILGQTLGVAPTPAAVTQAIQQGGQAAADKIAALEAAQGQQISAQVAIVQAQMADMADARAQTVQLAKTGSPIAWGAATVSVLMVGAFGLIGAFVVWHGTSDSQGALMVLGALIANNTQVCNYWLGSSAGSKAKDAVIATSLSKAR